MSVMIFIRSFPRVAPLPFFLNSAWMHSWASVLVGEYSLTARSAAMRTVGRPLIVTNSPAALAPSVGSSATPRPCVLSR